MKSIIKNEEKVVKSDYPCLKIYNNDSGFGEYVVLFTEPKRGVVVHCGNEHLKVGDSEKIYGDYWAEDCFVPFTGTIELSNE